MFRYILPIFLISIISYNLSDACASQKLKKKNTTEIFTIENKNCTVNCKDQNTNPNLIGFFIAYLVLIICIVSILIVILIINPLYYRRFENEEEEDNVAINLTPPTFWRPKHTNSNIEDKNPEEKPEMKTIRPVLKANKSRVPLKRSRMNNNDDDEDDSDLEGCMEVQ